MTEESVIGKRLPRVDALDKVTGRAIYSADISLPHMLYGKVLRSPHAHANIRRLDVSKARAMDGVKVVITAEDTPGRGFDFAKEKAFFAGQPVAAVAAVDLQTAEKALELIEVDYEVLPPVTDVLEAMKPDAPVVCPGWQAKWFAPRSTPFTKADPGSGPSGRPLPNNVAMYSEYGRGDVEAGFEKADIVLENTFRTQRVNQGYLEPRAAVASAGPDGKVTIWTDNQGLFPARGQCAAQLKLPLSKIKMMPVEVGGAFGGKIGQTIGPICALLSLKSGYPVKVVTTRAEEFTANRPAPPATFIIKLGADKEGHLIAVSAKAIYDVGGIAGFMPASLGGSINGLSPYRIPNVEVVCYDIFTNQPPAGGYRAPGTPQSAFAMESQMDLLARALGIDPIELRIRNAVSEGDLLVDGSTFPKITFKEILEEMKEHLSKRAKPEGPNRGRGIACGLWRASRGFLSAHVNVNADGTVVLATSAVDLTGSRTSFAQLVAEEFGIPFEKVTVVIGDTETTPYCDLTSGSRQIHATGVAVCRACQDAKDQLVQQAALQLQMKPDELEFVNGSIRAINDPEKSVSLADAARSTVTARGGGPVTGGGSLAAPEHVPLFVAQMADVEVDRETGKVEVLSYVAVQDAGKVINPTLVEGQVQGAVTSGTGWALLEDYILKDGIMQNSNFLDYRMPTSLDAPTVEPLILETGTGPGPSGARGVGEPPHVPCLATLANAIHSAAGVRMKELPMNPEAVFRALQAQEKAEEPEK